MERRISGVSYMCWMDFHNTFLCCGFLCARLILLYFVSILCLSFRLPRRGLPRPILITTGYHACVYIPVITPELSRSTTHVHRVITPAISNSYFVVCLSPAFTPPVLLHLHHHRAPHVPTYSTRWRIDRTSGTCVAERYEENRFKTFVGGKVTDPSRQTRQRRRGTRVLLGQYTS